MWSVTLNICVLDPRGEDRSGRHPLQGSVWDNCNHDTDRGAPITVQRLGSRAAETDGLCLHKDRPL